MPTYREPICLNCTRFDKANKQANTCDAYPDGIPLAILQSEVDHHEPYKNDNGIRFEPVDTKKDWRRSLEREFLQ